MKKTARDYDRSYLEGGFEGVFKWIGLVIQCIGDIFCD
jgi:hypothetical protein